ncbi:MAG: hypothetical protein RJB66_2537 [Pseudomonadota bacterium]
MQSIYSFEAKTISGKLQSFDIYKGKVLLIVNTASLCGLTPQYEGLQKLHEKFNSRGLEILAFPCDQFGHQEPGDSSAIKDFCETKYSIQFTVFEKIEVNGAQAHPLFQYLKKSSPGFLGTEAIKWNFTKFLINKSGEIVERFAPTTTPESIATQIESLLEAST